jgi:hypothetical protein
MKILKYITLGTIVLVVFMLISHEVNMKDPKYRHRVELRNTIDACWEEQSRKSHSPAVARFVAGTCESLEAQLRNMPR